GTRFCHMSLGSWTWSSAEIILKPLIFDSFGPFHGPRTCARERVTLLPGTPAAGTARPALGRRVAGTIKLVSRSANGARVCRDCPHRPFMDRRFMAGKFAAQIPRPNLRHKGIRNGHPLIDSPRQPYPLSRSPLQSRNGRFAKPPPTRVSV